MEEGQSAPLEIKGVHRFMFDGVVWGMGRGTPRSVSLSSLLFTEVSLFNLKEANPPGVQ